MILKIRIEYDIKCTHEDNVIELFIAEQARTRNELEAEMDSLLLANGDRNMEKIRSSVKLFIDK